MFANFFQLSPIPLEQLIGSYNTHLVILSFMVAVSASYIALDLTGRIRDINNTPSSKLLWLIGGSIAMGSGIWSMHFIGMLSFNIPGLTLRYDLFWTTLSLLVAIFASGFALYLLQSSKIQIQHYIVGGIVLGLSIASMHYTGMEAMLITLNIRYLPALFFVSILIAIIASEAALWLALQSNKVVLRLRTRIKIASAVIMGIAICGMHYTAMSASIFTPLCTPATVGLEKGALDPTYLSVSIAAITFIILAIALLASTYKEAMNQQQFERARQLGMAEISASVLHNVGNVLNSVNVSAITVTEKISNSKLVGLIQLSQLLNEHKNNLPEFLTKDSRGRKVIDFIENLSQYWHEEQRTLSAELNQLTNNLELIKNIVSTQQELSKTTNFDQIILVTDLLDEALLITGLNLSPEIKIEKHYAKIKPIKLDKVKLLQTLVNVLRNAKDAEKESTNPEKLITIKTSIIDDKKIRIEIFDNGVGISHTNISKIFNYGFTTKKSGHGFGLHTSAIAIHELNGSINAKSDGLNKGATFTIELPFNQENF